jgi:hypothetical protein
VTQELLTTLEGDIVILICQMTRSRFGDTENRWSQNLDPNLYFFKCFYVAGVGMN